jgi:hypothetical protein
MGMGERKTGKGRKKQRDPCKRERAQKDKNFHPQFRQQAGEFQGAATHRLRCTRFYLLKISAIAICWVICKHRHTDAGVT